MLDLDHPRSKHIFAAARLKDSILTLAKDIVSAPASERELLATRAKETLDAMRALNADHFDDSPWIDSQIDHLDKALHRMAKMKRPNLDVILPVLFRLGSPQGFRTTFI